MIAFVTQKQGANRYGEPADSLIHMSVSYVRSLGFTPVPIPNELATARELASQLDYGFLLVTGGGFVPVEFFANRCDDAVAQPERDAVERFLVADAVGRGIPVMGLCRGMHMLNGIFGGKVVRNGSFSAPRHNHFVRFAGGRRVLVNTFHNNAVPRDQLAGAFECLAVEEGADGAGNVECFRGRDKRILGLQWHPERPLPGPEAKRASRELADWLIKGTPLPPDLAGR